MKEMRVSESRTRACRKISMLGFGVSLSLSFILSALFLRRTSNSGLPAKVSFRETEGENRKQPKGEKKRTSFTNAKRHPVSGV